MTFAGRTLCPGELRFRAFGAGPGKGGIFVAGPISGLIAGAMGTIRIGLAAGVAMGVVLAGVVTAVEWVKRPPIERNAEIHPVTLEVTPWGVAVGPHSSFRPGPSRFAWSAILSIEEHTRVVKRRDETLTVHVLYVEVAPKKFLQAQSDSFDAPTLAGYFPRFGPAVRRRFAVGMHGEAALDPGTPGLSSKIIDAARRVVGAAEPASWFSRIDGKDYRARGGVELTPEATAALIASLTEEPTGDVDAAPLHAVILAECGVVSAIEPLLALTMSPSPMIAVAARAAALRIGASQVHTGPIDEIGDHLPADERAAWSNWAREGQAASKSPSGATG